MFEPNAVIVALLLCVPAMIMAFSRSTWLVDYLFLVVAVNRGIRRIVDYNNGYFNPFSLISLTPIIVGGFAVLVVLNELNRNNHGYGRRASTVLYLYGGVVAYAFVVGFLNAKFGAVYALGDYIAPIGLIGYGALWGADPRVFSRWSTSFALTAVIVAVYGLWQFYTIPAWDAFWLKAVNLVGYMGRPLPTQMTLFSTMAERGPAAMYLCSGAMLLILRPGTLSIFRWPCAALVLYAMLLTYARTAIIFTGLAILLYPLLNRGSGIFSVLLLSIIALVGGQSILNRLPGQASSRVESISTLQDDASLQGRLRLLGYAMKVAAANPFGLGIGSGGLASRVQRASKEAVMDSTGYAETLTTYGWIGFFVVVALLYRIWNSSSQLVALGSEDDNVRILRAWFIAGMIALFSGNWLAGASFFWLLAGYSLGRMDSVENAVIEGNEHSGHSGVPQLN